MSALKSCKKISYKEKTKWDLGGRRESKKKKWNPNDNQKDIWDLYVKGR